MFRVSLRTSVSKCGFHFGRPLLNEAVERPAVVQTKATKLMLKKREDARLAKRKREAKLPASQHRLYMPVAQALRFLRAVEIGQPQEQQIISLSTLIVGDKRAQALQGEVSLPHPIKKPVIAVFTTDEAQRKVALEEFNCDVVGGVELVDDIKDGKAEIKFNMAFATPEMAVPLRKIARSLSPRNCFPSEKKQTMGPDIRELMKLKIGKMPFKQKGNTISFGFARCNLSDKQVLQNLVAIRASFADAISSQQTKQKSILGKTTLSTTHGPGIVIDFA